MRAILVDAPNAAPVLTTVPEPALPPHGALVEVRATGVCRSDWHAWVGHDPTVAFPHVPGHEFAGVVRAVGARVQRFQGGERVTAPFCCGCGSCVECRAGHQNLCEHEYQPGFDGWGSFAELVMVPWADVNLVPLPEELGFDVAASLGCRFTTSYAGLTAHARVKPGESVAVFGCGGVGLSAVMIASRMGARVIAVDTVQGKLDLAQELGGHAVVNVSETDPVEAILELTGGGAHVSVDALGSASTAGQGVRSLRKRGRHLQLGLLLGQDATPNVPLELAIKRELSILGTHGMQARRYPEMLDFIASSDAPLEALIGARRPLGAAGEVLASMGSFAPVGVTILHP
ncbi:MAG: alcohol dehydrogenase catalytic domain-containing protein [Trueperaceae bacterium]